MIVSVPGGRFCVFRIACLVAFSSASPICALPFRNTTVPVGIPVVVEDTFAVKITFCPRRVWVAEAVNDICELAGVTIRLAVPLLARSLPWATNVAVTISLPVGAAPAQL